MFHYFHYQYKRLVRNQLNFVESIATEIKHGDNILEYVQNIWLSKSTRCKMKRTYDDDYVNWCISDLKKWREFLADKGNVDCIIVALEDYKRMKM